MKNVWKKIDSINLNSSKECLDMLLKKKYVISPWINNIFKGNQFKFDKINFPVSLVRYSLKELNFNNQTELLKVYEKSKDMGLELVPPQIALYARLIYDEQPKGEWLRFATPLKSMIDSDGVPHLPKFGNALGLYFIETYWAYEKAIFHPHNEFVFVKKNT